MEIFSASRLGSVWFLQVLAVEHIAQTRLEAA